MNKHEIRTAGHVNENGDLQAMAVQMDWSISPVFLLAS